jgi:hypothetical protein
MKHPRLVQHEHKQVLVSNFKVCLFKGLLLIHGERMSGVRFGLFGEET